MHRRVVFASVLPLALAMTLGCGQNARLARPTSRSTDRSATRPSGLERDAQTRTPAADDPFAVGVRTDTRSSAR